MVRGGILTRKSTLGANKMFPAAHSPEFPFSASTCQESNLSEEKAIYTGIKRAAESISEAASGGFGLFWRLPEDGTSFRSIPENIKMKVR